MVTKRDRERDKAESSTSQAAGKSKMWVNDKPDAGGMDELLEALGYKVRSSDMADVAQMLEQLEMAMGTNTEDEISQLADTVHYNPADILRSVQSLLSELGNDESSVAVNETSSTTIDLANGNGNNNHMYVDDSEYDLSVIPGGAVHSGNKRIKTAGAGAGEVMNSENSMTVESGRGLVLVDSQEAGIRLVHTLGACAEAIQQENLKLADALVRHIGLLAVSQAGAMRKVATYFAGALARRIYKSHPQDVGEMSDYDMLEMHFYDSCPYLKFAHFTANQAILEAFDGVNRVHVVDFSLKQGMQWPPLLQALARRPCGPPVFRLTGIAPPHHSDALQQVGWKLAQLAETFGIEFEFRGFVANSPADIDASVLDIRPTESEALVVNSVFELHKLLGRPGAIEKVLNSIKAMKPKIVTIAEQESNHNGQVFLDRFNEALHYYSTMFDSLESSGSTQTSNARDLLMSEVYLGRQICNVVACEGPDRVERHEMLSQWRVRMRNTGFDPVHLGSNAYKQASMLLAFFAGGDGYRVEENDGCLMLGWHTRPLIATSAWQLAVENS